MDINIKWDTWDTRTAIYLIYLYILINIYSLDVISCSMVIHSSSWKKSKQYEKLCSKKSPNLPPQVSFPLSIDKSHLFVSMFLLLDFLYANTSKYELISILIFLHTLMMATLFYIFFCFNWTLSSCENTENIFISFL